MMRRCLAMLLAVMMAFATPATVFAENTMPEGEILEPIPEEWVEEEFSTEEDPEIPGEESAPEQEPAGEDMELPEQPAEEEAEETEPEEEDPAEEETEDAELLEGEEVEGVELPEEEEFLEEGLLEEEVAEEGVLEEDYSLLASVVASGNCGAYGYTLIWTLTDDGTLTISGEGAMANYAWENNHNALTTPWYRYTDRITTLELDERITTIGDYAFYYCSALTGELVIPEGVTEIGAYAFFNCGFSGNLNIPDRVTSIGTDAFVNCSNLNGSLYVGKGLKDIYANAFGGTAFTAIEIDADNQYFSEEDLILYNKDKTQIIYASTANTGELSIADNVTSIGAYAFYGCHNITGDLVIPDSVTSIGEGAFNGCYGITGKLVISDSVTSISAYVFGDCGGITGEVVIPDSVTHIGEGAFQICEGITSVVFGNSVISIGYDVFYGCENLTDIFFKGKAPSVYAATHDWPSFPENATLHYDHGQPGWTMPSWNGYNTVPCAPYIASGYCGGEGDGKNLSWALTEDGTLTISGSGRMKDNSSWDSFWWDYRSQIRAVIGDEGVTSIGTYAFENCTRLTSVSLPSGITSIPEGAFRNCESLLQIELPPKVASIGDSAFYSSGLRSITFPDSVTSIGADAFRYTDISSLDLNNVTSLGDGALGSCSSLKFIDLSKVTDIGIDVLGHCGYLEEVILPETMTVLPEQTFESAPYSWGNISLKVVLPSKLTTIGYKAFYDGGITHLNLPESLATIEGYAFSKSNLGSVAIPSKVTSIEQCTFSGCKNLYSAAIPATVTFIHATAFEDCPNLTIYGEAGSMAETYALANDIPFKTIDDMPPPLTGITLGVEKISIKPGECYKLTAKPIPSNAFIGKVNFIYTGDSDHFWIGDENYDTDEIAGPDSCFIESWAPGTYTVTASCGEFSDSVEVFVVDTPNYLYISQKPNKITYKQGEALDITGLEAILVYKNSYAGVDVTDKCTISGYNPAKTGKQTITVSYTEGGKPFKDTFTVTVTAAPKAKSLAIVQNGTAVTGKTLSIGLNGNNRTIQLQAVPSPADIGTSIVWSSSSAKVATVDQNGMVTAVAKGSATITAKDSISGKSAKVKINVAYLADSVSISGPAEVALGKSVKLTAQVLPAAATNKKVTWSTSNPSVASVSNGTVKGVKAGSAVITATAADGSGVYAEHYITVFPVVTKVDIFKGSEIVSGSKTGLGIDLASENRTISLTAQTNPEGAADGITWKSSSAKVATVDQDGNVTALSKGSTTITATATDGSKKSATVKITVANLAKEITVSGPDEMAAGKSIKLTAVVGPNSATNKKVTWTSSNTNVATVSNGTVKAKAQGTVIITAIAADGSGVSAQHTITVFPVVTKVDIFKGSEIVSGNKTGLGIDLASNDRTISLTACTYPDAAADGITWKSSSAKVATVDQNGVVTGVGKGTATITATATDGSKKSATVKINVAYLAKEITISGPDEMAAGKSVKLVATVGPNNATNKKVTWISSNTNVATVSNGTVKANAKLKGTSVVTITATAADGSGVYAQHTITIKPVVSLVMICEGSSSYGNGTKFNRPLSDGGMSLSAITQPDDAGKGVTWKSSSAKVATVDQNGEVTFLKKGSVTITATATDGSKKSASIKITIV